MSQLWNMFNTLQILLALPMLAVITPSNVLFMVDIMNQVVNFNVMDHALIQEQIITPILDTKDDDDRSKNSTRTEGSSDAGAEKDQVSLLAQSFLITAMITLFAILIGIIILCKRKVYPKCCNCFKSVVNFIQAKLMFNSVLRALI